jgi:hypothetical protein
MLLKLKNLFADSSTSVTASSEQPGELMTLRPVAASPQGFAYTTPCLVAGSNQYTVTTVNC